MLRRTFLAGGAAALAGGAIAPAVVAGATRGRTLVLLELAGGNDGLNTVVPYADPAYAAARPTLALRPDQVHHLDQHFGLHPELSALMAAWRDRDLAVLMGVGYDRPNRSHFRSIDIWETASDSDQVLSAGWIARLLKDSMRNTRSVADAVVLGGKSSRVVEGAGIRAVSMMNPERFVRQARGVKAARMRTRNPALAHLLSVQAQIDQAAFRMGAIVRRSPRVTGDFTGPLGRQMRVAARLILANASIPVIKVSLSGFDTHVGQPGRHRNIMRQLGRNLAAFRKALMAGGAWNNTAVLTYSEFGRRVRQNGSGGTDHGTASTHFLTGGKIRGGLVGVAPSLTDLGGGDLRHTMDYRRMYATVAQGWLGVADVSAVLGRHQPLDLVKA